MTKFICIGGKAQNGKSTVSEMMSKLLSSHGERVLCANYADLLKYICKAYFGWDGVKDEHGRTLLQKVGTDTVRKQNENYWVDFVLGVVKMFPGEWDYVIIGDCRFPNEINRIKEFGYEADFVRVVRPMFDNRLTEEQKNHPSEIALDDTEADYTIINDGDWDALIEKVCKVCRDMESKKGGYEH